MTALFWVFKSSFLYWLQLWSKVNGIPRQWTKTRPMPWVFAFSLDKAYFLPVSTLCDVSYRQKVTMSGGKHGCASLLLLSFQSCFHLVRIILCPLHDCYKLCIQRRNVKCHSSQANPSWSACALFLFYLSGISHFPITWCFSPLLLHFV